MKNLLFVTLLALSLAPISAAHAGDYDSLVTKDIDGGWAETLIGEIDIPSTQLTVKITLYVFAGGKYLGVYWQGDRNGYLNGGQSYINTSEQFIQGGWSVTDGKLVLAGIGSGTMATSGRGLSFHLAKDLGATNVKQQQIDLKMTRTSAGVEIMRNALKRVNIQPAF